MGQHLRVKFHLQRAQQITSYGQCSGQCYRAHCGITEGQERLQHHIVSAENSGASCHGSNHPLKDHAIFGHI